MACDVVSVGDGGELTGSPGEVGCEIGLNDLRRHPERAATCSSWSRPASSRSFGCSNAQGNTLPALGSKRDRPCARPANCHKRRSLADFMPDFSAACRVHI